MNSTSQIEIFFGNLNEAISNLSVMIVLIAFAITATLVGIMIGNGVGFIFDKIRGKQ